jgi:prevent-host-death family protein
MVRKLSAKEARDNFSDLIGSVHYSREAVIVEKQGRPFVVVVNPDEYEHLVRAREERFAVLNRLHAKNPTVSPEEAEADALREIAAARGHASPSEPQA